jgi:hypothetical protein
MALIEVLSQETRLALWDRLIRGERVSTDEIVSSVAHLSRDESTPSRFGCVMLLAVAHLAQGMRTGSLWRIQGALWYWFSQGGHRDRPDDFAPEDLVNPGLGDLAGLHLTWPEVMIAMGRNPKDYTALKRIEADLKKQYAMEWKGLFGTEAPTSLHITEGR